MIKPVLNEFDSSIFGIRIGNIEINNTHPNNLISMMPDVDESDFDYITVKCNPSKRAIIFHLEDLGYRFLDISLEYAIYLSVYPRPDISNFIRFATLKDLDQLYNLSDSYFSLSKYHKDPALDYKLAQHLYREWIKNSIEGTYGDGILVYDAGIILGFTSFRLDKKLKSIAYIDLTATTPDIVYGEVSVGMALLDACLYTLYKKEIRVVSTSTQSSNHSSISLLERMGFKYQRSFITLSKEVSNE